MSWFLYAILAALSITAYALIVRRDLRARGDAKAMAVLINLLGGFFLFVLAVFDRNFVHLTVWSGALLVAASLVLAGSSVLFVEGRQLTEASRVSIVRQTTIIWIYIGGVLLFGDSFTLLKTEGIALILVGSVIALWKRHGFARSKGVLLILVGSALGSITSLLTKAIVDNALSPALFGGVVSLLAALWVFLFLPGHVERFRCELKLQGRGALVISFFSGLSFFFLVKGYEVGEVSRVAPVYSSAVVFVVVAGTLLLHEHDGLAQKALGALLVIAGIVILKVF